VSRRASPAVHRYPLYIVQPTILDYLRLHGDISLLEILAPEEFVGKNLMELRLRERYGITVIAIFGPERKAVSPRPDCVIEKTTDSSSSAKTTT